MTIFLEKHSPREKGSTHELKSKKLHNFNDMV